jgi:DNA polymerase sigma
MKNEFNQISLNVNDIQERKELICFVRNKLRNREYEDGEDPGEIGQSFYDTGLQIEIFGSYGSGLSTKNSDIDMRVNDPYTYRYLNLD